jgi:adenine/guanine phosphoribosyltransferase-like PRPP-binding protein
MAEAAESAANVSSDAVETVDASSGAVEESAAAAVEDPVSGVGLVVGMVTGGFAIAAIIGLVVGVAIGVVVGRRST